MTVKTFALALALAASTLAGAQAWIPSYDAGLAAAKANKWSAAREAFQQAIASRGDDQSRPTTLPGPATERKLWRNGAPYSPNFLAAYSLYREGVQTTDPGESEKDLRGAANEFETLINKDQPSAEAFFFLDVIYARLGDLTKRQASADRLAKLGGKANFKVDTEVVSPEELAALNARTSPAVPLAGTPPGVVPTPGATVKPGAPFGSGPTISLNGNVQPLKDKFALVIGQSDSRVPGGAIPYAATDAKRMRDALVNFSGYPDENVVLLQNASAAEIRKQAADLASRTANNATVFVFFAGAGANVDGKDYLAGTDTASVSDVASMVSKVDLFRPFVVKGARIFSFFEANRPIDANGFYFGRETVTEGEISQMQSTRPGDTVSPVYQNDQAIGTFTDAIVKAMADIRSNRLPIGEFGWQIFNRMRHGDSGRYGGGGSQVCTLPVVNRLAQDARF